MLAPPVPIVCHVRWPPVIRLPLLDELPHLRLEVVELLAHQHEEDRDRRRLSLRKLDEVLHLLDRDVALLVVPADERVRLQDALLHGEEVVAFASTGWCHAIAFLRAALTSLPLALPCLELHFGVDVLEEHLVALGLLVEECSVLLVHVVVYGV